MTQIPADHVGQTTSTTFGCESRGPSQLHGHNPWLVCELGLSWDSVNMIRWYYCYGGAVVAMVYLGRMYSRGTKSLAFLVSQWEKIQFCPL